MTILIFSWGKDIDITLKKGENVSDKSLGMIITGYPDKIKIGVSITQNSTKLSPRENLILYQNSYISFVLQVYHFKG